jgi:hypothetical protein
MAGEDERTAVIVVPDIVVECRKYIRFRYSPDDLVLLRLGKLKVDAESACL